MAVSLPCRLLQFVLGLSRMPWAPSCTYRGRCNLPPAPAKDAPGSQAGRHFLHLYFSRHLLSVLFPIITRLPLWLLLRQGISIVPLVPAGRGCPGSGSDPAGAPQAVPLHVPVGLGAGNSLCLFPVTSTRVKAGHSLWSLVLGWGTSTIPCAITAAFCPGARCSRVVWKRGWRGGTSVGTACALSAPVPSARQLLGRALLPSLRDATTARAFTAPPGE